MSIPVTTHERQYVSAFDADLDQLAQDMNRLHEAAYLVGDDDERQHFARLEHAVNWRLNALAEALAAQDGHGLMFPQ